MMGTKQIRANWTEDDYGRYIALPSKTVIEDHGDGTATVEVPAEYLDENDQLDEAAIRKLYRGTKWDRDGVVDGVQASEGDGGLPL